MRPTFPSRDQLSAMSVQQLRSLDITDAEEEALVQEILNAKLVNLPPEHPIYRNDIPDIKTPEEEEKYQAIIDERTAQFKPVVEPPEEIYKQPVEIPVIEEEKKKVFCEYCDSKGFRHKKDCCRPK